MSPEAMTSEQIAEWMRSPEFTAKRLELARRIKAGEPMTLEYCAQQLQLPFLVLAGWIGDYAVRTRGVIVAIYDDPPAVRH